MVDGENKMSNRRSITASSMIIHLIQGYDFKRSNIKLGTFSGAAASAPIVAAAFHPSLATVGVLLAVFGYAVGTIAAIGCTILMQLVSP